MLLVTLAQALLTGMTSLREVISGWALPTEAVQKLGAWLAHPDQGWNLSDPPDEAFYNLGDGDLVASTSDGSDA
jgi:hypothetical protein